MYFIDSKIIYLIYFSILERYLFWRNLIEGFSVDRVFLDTLPKDLKDFARTLVKESRKGKF